MPKWILACAANSFAWVRSLWPARVNFNNSFQPRRHAYTFNFFTLTFLLDFTLSWEAQYTPSCLACEYSRLASVLAVLSRNVLSGARGETEEKRLFAGRSCLTTHDTFPYCFAAKCMTFQPRPQGAQSLALEVGREKKAGKSALGTRLITFSCQKRTKQNWRKVLLIKI